MRPGAVIAVGSRIDRPDYDYAIAPTFEVFAMAPGQRRTVRLFDTAGAEQVRVEVERAGDQLSGTVANGREHLAEGWTLRWVTGPRGQDRGTEAAGATNDRELVLRVA